MTGEAMGAARYKKAFEGVAAEKWRVFKDAKEIGE